MPPCPGCGLSFKIDFQVEILDLSLSKTSLKMGNMLSIPSGVFLSFCFSLLFFCKFDMYLYNLGKETHRLNDAPYDLIPAML